MAEVIEAADRLAGHGIGVDVVCVTSADLIFRAVQARDGLGQGPNQGPSDILDRLFPADRAAPIVTVLDGHPHTMSFLGSINQTKIANLGVQDFGRSGDLADLYAYFGIDVPTIVGAAFDLIDG
jgi:pyruvate dehydrogenase E1 component